MPAPTAPTGGLRVRLLAAAATVLAVVAVVALAARGDARVQPQAAAVADPSSAEVDALLHGHADALLRRDRDAYAAGLDDAPAATQFRATQLAVFDHTTGVPFASFDLRYDRTVADDAPLAAARARLGDDTAHIVRVDLTYAFAGIDARPVEHAVYLTLVHRAGGWKLAGDQDLAATGGPSWRGPWDFGPLVVARGRTALVLVHPASDAPADVVRTQQLATAVAGDVDAGVTAVNGVWGTAWSQRVAVVVAASQPELTSLAGDGYSLTAVAGLAVAEPSTSVAAGPDVSAGQRIVLSGPAVPGLTPTGRAVLLRHELTHVATRSVTTEAMPTWVIEGFADYIGNLAGTQPVRTVATELAAQVTAGHLPTALPADAAFVPADGSAGDAGTTGTTGTTGTAASDDGPAVAYEQAWYAVRTVAQLGGPTAPAAFYRAVATAATAGRTDAVDAALRQVAGVDTATFTARWRALIAAELS